MEALRYTELQVTSNFTFRLGGSHPEELVEHADALGYKAIAITDRNSLAGIVRAHLAARGKHIKFIPACRLDLADGPSLLAYPTDRPAYSRLSSLLTRGNLRTEKGKCELYKADVYDYAQGMKFIVVPPAELNKKYDFEPAFKDAVAEYKRILGNHVYLGAIFTYQGNDTKKLFRLSQLSNSCFVPMVAINDVHYHDQKRRELQDILVCIREKCTIFNAGFRLHQNAERYLKPEQEIIRLFRQYPDAIRRTQEIADACTFSLDELRYDYPVELTTGGRTPQQELEMLAWKGAKRRFGEVIPDKIKKSLHEELDFMKRKNYAPYFLNVNKNREFADEQKILNQGRGSAANSVVCYCLGITSVDPSKFRLLFARFMSDDRDEPPDIDIDFEHERREEVIQFIYNTYGRDRAGIVATVTQVHWRTAIRDVGKAMGLSLDAVDFLAKSGYEISAGWLEGKAKAGNGFMATDPHIRKAIELAIEYEGFPRQLGQHTGGFVITNSKLFELCPILNATMEGRTCIEWNKDDIEALGFLKMDILALGMLTCVRKSFNLIEQHYGRTLTLASVPYEDDPRVYDMICQADTIGVFQIESRAQMSMLPRLRPRCFYDLVIQVAIVRPGPIQGDMVHPYLTRRNNPELISYPSKGLEEILGRTLGVPLFQEQAMEIAIVAAGFTPAEADGLRRSMATFKAKGQVTQWRQKLVSGMVERGYQEDFAGRVFKQLEGFGSYGFPESHAASFALLAYISSWIKYYYPDVFCCALLNSQPMGFYQPAQIVIDARKHGVEVRPVDVNFSQWDSTLEAATGKYHAVRLGLRQVGGAKETEMQLLVKSRTQPYRTIDQLHNIGISQASLERLADADAFRSMGLDRRDSLWQIAALADKPVGLFQGQPSESEHEPEVQLPQLSQVEHVLQDYSSTGLSLNAHPVSFVRDRLFRQKVLANKELELWPDGTFVRVSGLVLVKQRPGTASGICFITIEDETGIANLVVFQSVFKTYRKEIMHSRLLMVSGTLQKADNVTHVVVRRCYNMNWLLQEAAKPKELPARVKSKKALEQQVVQGELFPSRSFK
ncbi:error-prone DNA polymerase [Niabella sp. CC-SYL272]|uniref:error-prone DNA polymerase n=1 Tax=Niabella agricola TaxID=2891571 RepID=UPI001F1E678A|nr:error-prone DNA polymerase [Niabella agricola]MCF3109556.1 error-prone DNA polymerase [Niabella agricola]